MSAICIAVLQIDGPALIDCCDLAILEEEHGSGIRFDGFYVEPFLESYRSIGGRLINFSDNSSVETCEALLCPDYCNVEQIESRCSFETRLKKIVQSVGYFKDKGARVELFLGESGETYDDYEHITCKIEQAVSVILSKYDTSKAIPSLHLIFK